MAVVAPIVLFVRVSLASPVTLIVFAAAAIKSAIVDAEPDELILIVFTVGVVTAPVVVKPFTFKANVVTKGVLNDPIVTAADVPVPLSVRLVSAPEFTVAAAKLSKVTFVIVPAADVDPEFTSVIVTAPFVRPATPASDAVAVKPAAAFESVTVTLVVEALPVTVTAPAMVAIPAAAWLAAVWFTVTFVPPVTVIAPCVLPFTAVVLLLEFTVTAPAAADVAPIVIVSNILLVEVTAIVEPPFTAIASAVSAASAFLTFSAVVADDLTVAPPTLIVFKLVIPLKPDVEFNVTVPPDCRFTISTLDTVAPTGAAIAAVCTTLKVSIPAPPSILSPAVHVGVAPGAATSEPLNVSSPEVPTKEAPVSAPAVSDQV
jgi:hypothetical protein